MEYGSKSITVEKLYLYQGYNPATKNFPPDNGVHKGENGVIDQRTADVFYLWQKVSVHSFFFLLCSGSTITPVELHESAVQ